MNYLWPVHTRLTKISTEWSHFTKCSSKVREQSNFTLWVRCTDHHFARSDLERRKMRRDKYSKACRYSQNFIKRMLLKLKWRSKVMGRFVMLKELTVFLLGTWCRVNHRLAVDRRLIYELPPWDKVWLGPIFQSLHKFQKVRKTHPHWHKRYPSNK